MIDYENATSDYAYTLDKKEGTLSVSYCLQAKRFVLKMWTNDEWLCLHQETILEEQEEIKQFVLNKAKTVFVLKNNGKHEQYQIDDFSFSFEDGYMEHNSKNIAVNLFKSIVQSYSYQYDSRGEIIDKEPFTDVIIL